MPDDAGTDPYPLVERELGLLMGRSRGAAALLAERAHPDLDGTAYPLLVHVSRVPGVRSCDLAAYVGVGRATISRQVHRLEELGLLNRRPDPQDARGQQLQLTAEGSRLVADAGGGRRV